MLKREAIVIWQQIKNDYNTTTMIQRPRNKFKVDFICLSLKPFAFKQITIVIIQDAK